MESDTVRRSACRWRRGASFVEFIGLAAAMAGGVVLGSMYLGVDVNRAAMSALQIAGLSTQATTAANGDPADAEPASTANRPSEATEADAIAVVAEQVRHAAEPPAGGLAPTQAFSAASILTLGDSLTEQDRRELTRQYWTALEQCMQEEVACRTEGLPDAANLQLYDFLSHRGDGHRAAAKRIAALSDRGVDPHVTAYAQTARRWHAEGAKLFSRAVNLLTDAPTAQLSGPFAQSWQSAATQHRMEERLLLEKRAAVQTWLDHSQRTAEAAAASSP